MKAWRVLILGLLVALVVALAPAPATANGAPASAPRNAVLGSLGTRRVLAILIDFPEYPAGDAASDVARRLDGPQDPRDVAYPYESLRAYYERASLGKLEIRVDTFGWYRSPMPRSQVPTTPAGREALIAAALRAYRARGMDLSAYDNDHDGTADYTLVLWTGPSSRWSGFWWAYQTQCASESLMASGVHMGAYAWLWTDGLQGGAETVIHETGHALGLPDLYDSDKAHGPLGGVGGFDMMDSSTGDLNAYSKWMLGWITPTIVRAGEYATLRPAATSGDALVVMADPTADGPFSECWVVENRQGLGNDARRATAENGLAVWHVDGRLDAFGTFVADNSSTAHRLISLEEAGGWGGIERGMGFLGGDLWTTGASFTSSSTPSSAAFDGTRTGVTLDAISFAGRTAHVRLYVEGRGPVPAVSASASADRLQAAPHAPARVKRGARFVVAGSVSAEGAGLPARMTLRFSHWERGRWVVRLSRGLRLVAGSGGASYRGTIALPARGSWRVVATCPARAGTATTAARRISVR